MPHFYDQESKSASKASLLQEKRREEHHEADIVIVGAGIIGCALAVAFSRQGRSVILLERSLKEPDRIVGELLQPGGVQALEKLGIAGKCSKRSKNWKVLTIGLLDCVENIDAIPVYGYEVIYHAEPVHIPYPANAVQDGRRPEGRSFHHGRFIQNLRQAAGNEPNVTLVESTVTALVKNDWTGQILGVEAKTRGEKECV
jgi:squalene monooxygenase